MSHTTEGLRIAGISDTHFNVSNPKPQITPEEYIDHIQDMSHNADIIVHCGDFTDQGDIESAKVAANVLRHSSVPVLGVMGNHDYWSKNGNQIKSILTEDGGIQLLEGDIYTYDQKEDPVGFIGATGFSCKNKSLNLRNLQIEEEEFNALINEGLQNFKKNILNLPNNNTVGIFHFEPYKRKKTHTGELTNTIKSSNYGDVIDLYKDRFSVIFHGHDHNGVSEPVSCRRGFDLINVAAPVTIKMVPGIPYIISEIPVKQV